MVFFHEKNKLKIQVVRSTIVFTWKLCLLSRAEACVWARLGPNGVLYRNKNDLRVEKTLYDLSKTKYVQRYFKKRKNMKKWRLNLKPSDEIISS
jgi:hypothetical protein